MTNNSISRVSDNFSPQSECFSCVKSTTTAIDILKLHEENASNDTNRSIDTHKSISNNSVLYNPLEEMSLVDVLYYDKSGLFLKIKTSYADLDDDSIAPSAFQLSLSTDPAFHKSSLEMITITLRETETFIIFELPQKVEDARISTGQLIKINNKQYDKLTRSSHKSQITNADTQTINLGIKNCYTQLSKKSYKNQETYVNNWIMWDDYATHKISKEKNEVRPFISRKTKLDDINEQLFHIYYNTKFREAVRVILRILASNTFDIPLKLYKGLIKEDISNPTRTATYELKLLWTYSTDITKSRIVSAFAWNETNIDLLAVGYGPSIKSVSNFDNSDTKGFLLIWCAKNPQNPERTFNFKSPISALDWSKTKPNLIALGFYNGEIQVIDVSEETMIVVQSSSRNSSPSYKPHWNVQWWINDNGISESLNHDYNENEIYTANQDGRILCYSITRNFEAVEITRIRNIKKQINKTKENSDVTNNDIPIFDYSAALLLQKHPVQRSEYIVGSEQGYIFRYLNKLQHPTDSFLAHNGSIYSLEFSPFCPEIFITSGADWCLRIWCDGITEPLIELFSIKKAVIRSAAWCPTHSVILATITESEICIWDLASKIYEPVSLTFSPMNKHFYSLKFTKNGKQLVASDIDGNVFIFHLQGMPVANYDQRKALIQSIEQAMVLKHELLQEFKSKLNLA